MKISEMFSQLEGKLIAQKLLYDFLYGGSHNPNDFYKFIEEYNKVWKKGKASISKKTKWIRRIVEETGGEITNVKYDETLDKHIASVRMPDGEIQQFTMDKEGE